MMLTQPVPSTTPFSFELMQVHLQHIVTKYSKTKAPIV